ncbi:diguanylate cyclase (GGDEF)-like protein/PAS domain S-box-containing protein [Allocatelliglobosispora scoriae]|uniref:Diguanylate cyclase (GGDEF)-like protein/PAS domain S-box-containing protein n=1 Tax=Allocatelliglobosispora scoriae TaxID=643052 RepID=A0A841C3E8_9ACTN|nr:EAL domain-containing protein [Allocatelliglobosispora scoriae]MBB5874436.1 diguanylate cyclase (GGDEF)-like protein/PAS domain S-box-containing protein [Allocatelliglobosispora scoriae]
MGTAVRWFSAGFLAGLVGVFVLPDPWADLLWGAIGLGSAAAIAVGVRRHRPRPAWPWWLLFASLLLSITGDTVYEYLTDVRGLVSPLPSWADLFYLAMYPALIVAILSLARPGAAVRDRALPLDVLILGTGLGLLSWVFLINPHLLDADLTVGQRIVSVAYPVADVLVLAAVGRLIVVHRFTVAVMLLTIGATGLLVADVLNGMSELRGHGSVGGAADVGWMLLYGGWGAAALHPSMAELTRPLSTGVREIGAARQVWLLLASLLPMVVLLVEASRGRVHDTTAVSVFAAVSVGLVLTRLIGVLGSHRRELIRADAVRIAGTALVAAHDPVAVHSAIAAAVARLLPSGSAHSVAMPRAGSGLVPAITEPGARVIPVADLPPGLRAGVAGWQSALVCPLTLDEEATGDGLLGAIVVAAEQRHLITLPSAVETVAAQAALALERINLSREIVRRDSEQYFRALVQNTADVILIVDPGDQRVRYASPSATGLFGRTGLVGHDLLSLVGPASRAAAHEQLGGVRADEPSIRDWEIARPGDGTVIAEVLCQDLQAEPSVAGIVVTLRDATQQRRLQAELAYRAHHDSLTGLPNRAALQEQLHAAQGLTGAGGDEVAVLFLDLDDFKIVNDTLGHDYGDQLLQQVAARLTSIAVTGGTVARIGGDEFAVLLRGVRSPQEAERTAEQIIAALAEPFHIQDRFVSGRVSIGVATTGDPATVPDLLRRADLALYVAKSDGKARWRRHDPALSAAIIERLELRAAMETALARDEFQLAYQPIVCLDDHTPVGFEALVRWLHPTRGLLMPGDFIDLAEESDTIVALGTWVLREAAATAVAWPGTPYVSVNVSARQFHAKGFADTVLTALADTGLPPDRLMLELTESLLLRDDDHQVWNDLAILRDHGVQIAIDDFGTGYSALSYLRHAPIDVLKLDKVFTRAITSSAQETDLVDGIVQLAKTMRLKVIAEGIENPVERTLLHGFGCHFGQGYLFARPLDPAAVPAWLAGHSI